MDFIVTCYPFRQFISIISEHVSYVLVDFSCFLIDSDSVKQAVWVEVLLKGFDDEIFVVEFIIVLQLVQSVSRSSRRGFGLKNWSRVLVNLHLLLWVFTPDKLQTSVVLAWDNNLNKNSFSSKPLGCIQKQKLFQSDSATGLLQMKICR